MKQRVEGYLPKAIDLVSDKGIAVNGVVDSQFNGYVSSFGAAVIQSGLLPAVVFYSEKRGAEKERQKIINVIYELIKTDDDNEEDLLKYVLNHQASTFIILPRIIDAAAALKLAIRTYVIK